MPKKRRKYKGELATTEEANQLLIDGTILFAELHCRGIRIDREYCLRASKKVKAKIRKLKKQLQKTRMHKSGVRRFGPSFDPYSPQQLGETLFREMGLEVVENTPTGLPKVTEGVLKQIDDKGVRILLQIRKWNKIQSTYLSNIIRETVDGIIHPFFSLALVKTYRSSSQEPNFQNMPIRNKLQGNIIRGAFVPRDEDHHIVEIDYGGLEVCIAACYHCDPVMITYLTDPASDMHRDAAMDCFRLEESEVHKDIRYLAKNAFVFPEFYGSYFVHCARNMWERAKKPELVTTSGKPLSEHLKDVGFRTEHSFEQHIQRVEKAFWEDRFSVYAQWKKDQWDRYLKDGYVRSLTGFTYRGEMVRNEVINYPVQGSAFHCLLRSAIEIHRILNEVSDRSWLVGQIHDSIVADVHKDELDKFLKLSNRVMTQWLPSEWSWVNVPLTVEADVSPLGQPWSKKKPYPIPGVKG